MASRGPSSASWLHGSFTKGRRGPERRDLRTSYQGPEVQLSGHEPGSTVGGAWSLQEGRGLCGLSPEPASPLASRVTLGRPCPPSTASSAEACEDE